MTLTEWFAFLSYAVITAVTPGPNNILALSATSRYGIKKSKKLIMGIFSGFLCIMALCCGFCAMLSAILPSITVYMKYLGAAYIIWLAWHIALSQPASQGQSSESDLSFWKGFLLQFINVKIILWGVTVFAGYILPHHFSKLILCGYVILSALIGGGGTMLWALAGEVFAGFLQKRWRLTCIIMASLLFASALSLIIE